MSLFSTYYHAASKTFSNIAMSVFPAKVQDRKQRPGPSYFSEGRVRPEQRELSW